MDNKLEALIEQQKQPMQFDKFVAEAEQIRKLAESTEIVDQRSAEDAAALYSSAKNMIKNIEGMLEPFIKSAHALHKLQTTRRNELVDPFKAAADIVNQKIVKWHEAERLRIEAEQKKRDEEAQLEAALKAEEAGLEPLASAIMEGQVAVVGEAVEQAKLTNVTTAQVWSFEIEDVSKLPREYMIPDLTAIGAFVRARKGLAKIPGVKVFQRTSVKVKGDNLKGR